MGVNGVTGDDLMCTARRNLEGDCKGLDLVCSLILVLAGVSGLALTEERGLLMLGRVGFKTSEAIIGIASSSSSWSSSSSSSPTARLTLSVGLALRIDVLVPGAVSPILFYIYTQLRRKSEFKYWPFIYSAT